MFILVDDEGRENEGDLIIPASMATPEAINFMARYGRGLICLSLNGERVQKLGLPLMAQRNESRHGTAFTVSIEAREGISTGISAADRARTVAVAIDPDTDATDIATPGHIFPLMARDGGVLVRAGHTEAAVDVARLSGLSPAGVICEIMNDDGTMARMPDLVKFAQFHGLKIGTIADLIEYRRATETYVERRSEAEIDSQFGGKFRAVVYVNKIAYSEHIALVKGDVTAPGAVPVRMHALDVLSDALGDKAGKAGLLQSAMRLIANEDRGVIVLIREAMPTAVSDKIRRKAGENVPHQVELRDYGIGAQILFDLGVREMELLTNSDYDVVGLEGYGLTINGTRSIPIEEL
ncbi:MAG: 3,4-dihydroxy-2-butanone-4-phosphate synthase [Rhodospirillaceae bacterium]|nr:3,4-dihydroxy-2-butanone-4-phosphate synthase [Rhodospirillaceae bacterium]MBT5080120.1 3,4-dihydroxy-2-butanone-4-phosphate synthase [Rhodospirillaceae bacterium]MBT5526424.1 3,4-dihydroxy-2-butanone-4-phosphate synthase [Rhodospirillaceae bacterium]MBT5877966.1 3,4-dihydroxy-2-butanone-4-phosphate synthase [Rhodospirillaceae bacterium]MBT6590393.1 3,4-dihydroxy-2-butanone-4-phosphate synthase [Rhodospirillaceae bacterium]